MMFEISTIIIELLLITLIVALVTRRTRRPYTIALVIAGLILGMLQLVEAVHLSKELVMVLFLPPLLFEGALHIRAANLRPHTVLVLSLSVFGPLLTTLIIGGTAYWLLGFDLLSGLLLGVIIAPTDPVSVLATFRSAHVDEELATIVESESLFNDGIAVVLYIMLLSAIGGSPLDPLQGIGEFALVVGGGALVGLGVGFLSMRLLNRLGDHLVEVTVTLIAAFGAFLLAERLHFSGVIAVALAGLVIGNHGWSRAPSSETSKNVALFWEIFAFLVNSVLFLLIGFELRPNLLIDDLLSIVIVFGVLMASRALIVYGIGALSRWKKHGLPLPWQTVIFWGGLRGSVPVALALGIPTDLTGRDEMVAIVFGVVLFSLLGQGLTIPSLLRRLGLVQQETPHAQE
jgi:monovalent cation:H+ antiporter, CPA1 family